MEPKKTTATTLLLFVLVVFTFLNGCSTVSRTDCLLTDWYDLGRTDGMGGKPRSTFQQRAKPCIRHGVIPDRKAYYTGHDEGLSIYCTEQSGFDLGKNGLPYNPICPNDRDFRVGYDRGLKLYCTEENGYLIGVNGRQYNYVCPPQLEPDFIRGYEKGQKIYEYRAKVKSLENRLALIDHRIRFKEPMLYNDSLSDERISQIRSELRSLDIEYRRVSYELNYAIRDLEDYENSVKDSGF